MNRQALASGLYKGIGEVGLRHFPMIDGGESNIPADSAGMKEICDVAASRATPVTVHQNIMYLDELERLLQYNRACTVIWAHVGSVPPKFAPHIVPAQIKAREVNLKAFRETAR